MRQRRKSLLTRFSAFCCLLTATTPAQAASETPLESEAQGLHVSWLDYAREVPRAWSAGRDTPAMQMLIVPRASVMGGGEYALMRLRAESWGLRTGFAGFVELESKGETDSVNSGPLPSGQGPILWRGSFEYFVALAPLELGRRVCVTCVVELGLAYRHESQHVTASSFAGDTTEDYSDQPYVGDDVLLDAAIEQRWGRWLLTQRIVGKWFLPNRSSYSWGMAADVHARWTAWPVHPFVSAYAEYELGDELLDRRFPDAYRVRALLGGALPSQLGDIMIFLSGDVGHRYHVQGLSKEATLGLGVRLSLGAPHHQIASHGQGAR